MKRQKLKLIVKRPDKFVSKVVKRDTVKAVATARNGGTITMKGNK